MFRSIEHSLKVGTDDLFTSITLVIVSSISVSVILSIHISLVYNVNRMFTSDLLVHCFIPIYNGWKNFDSVYL